MGVNCRAGFHTRLATQDSLFFLRRVLGPVGHKSSTCHVTLRLCAKHCRRSLCGACLSSSLLTVVRLEGKWSFQWRSVVAWWYNVRPQCQR
mmetsp:Transcript_140945/g.316009  ORF Transcript_140945/g.316009 Transcript_140945/m.316009 type:complete len:91 (+) Transcript_140945:54-326(+)